ncbi:small, acid-soluble spore protein L [Virgibacillus oceani]
MSKKKNQYSKRRNDTSINPQGLTEDTEDQQPKSQLEQRAKKKNTKI